MKKVLNYVIEQEDLNEDNISEYITRYHNSYIKKSKNDATKNVLW